MHVGQHAERKRFAVLGQSRDILFSLAMADLARGRCPVTLTDRSVGKYSGMPQTEQKHVAGRRDILAAASDLFAESGYDGVSIQAIANRAATSKANVFHHFGAKDALYLAVMREACSGFVSASQLLDDDAGLDQRERIVAFLRGDLEHMHAEPERAHLILREILESGPGRGKALAHEVFDEHFQLVVRLFRNGQTAGIFASDIRPELAAVVMIATTVFLFQSRHVLRHFSGVDFVDDPGEYTHLVSRLLLDGMCHPPTRGS